MQTKIYLIRHTQTTGNVEKRLTGRKSFEITPVGDTYINLITDRLKNVKFDKVYSSTSKRAIKTVEPLAKLNHLEVLPNENLCEMYFGIYDGWTWDKVNKVNPKIHEDHMRTNEIMGIPEQEPTEVVANRMYAYIEKICQENAGKTILIGSHGVAIEAFLRKVTGEPFVAKREEYSQKNTSLNLLESDCEKNKFHLALLNDLSHLEKAKEERKNMREALISVIVPVYNVEKYLEECINSIINQTYKNLEIILVDDGATDNSGKMCDEFAKKDTRIKVIHKENGGLSDARNTGIDIACGEYIQFVDSDDCIENDMIELLYKNAKKYEADISMCSHYILTEEECTPEGNGELNIYDRVQVLKEILLDERVRSYAWNKLFAKELFNEIRFPKGKVFEDILTIPRLFEKSKKVVLDNQPKYYYRQRKGSILHVQTKELRIAYINSALEIMNFIKEKEKSLIAYCAYNVAHITIKTYNDIGLFDMGYMLEEDIVNKLYENTCEIFKNKEYEKVIVENSSYIKKLHFYYLICDKTGYIVNNKKLPLIYPGWKNSND